MRFQASPAPSRSRGGAFVLFRADGERSLPSFLDRALRDAASAALRAKEFTGRKGETLLLHGGGSRLLLTGLGDNRKAPGPDALRGAAGVAARQLEARGIAEATFLVPDGKDAADLARAVTEGL
ncbi:MAG: hypothetical protein L6Q95_01260, partial [Planctomycetes bacterium]|nr:hypothetical protein [Planctomycetota bacterium]